MRSQILLVKKGILCLCALKIYEQTFSARARSDAVGRRSFVVFFRSNAILQYFRADKPAGEVDERAWSGSKRYRSTIVHFEVKL